MFYCPFSRYSCLVVSSLSSVLVLPSAASMTSLWSLSSQLLIFSCSLDYRLITRLMMAAWSDRKALCLESKFASISHRASLFFSYYNVKPAIRNKETSMYKFKLAHFRLLWIIKFLYTFPLSYYYLIQYYWNCETWVLRQLGQEKKTRWTR